jgi:hypothetical protein
MKHLVRFELEDGSPVFVEVEDAGDSSAQRVGRGEEGIEPAKDRFVEAVARIRPAAEAGVLSPNPRKFREDRFHLFLAETFRN